jgi:hypothetical protein
MPQRRLKETLSMFPLLCPAPPLTLLLQDIPQSFMQNFVLKPAGDSFFIQHDVFRLVLHNVAAR